MATHNGRNVVWRISKENRQMTTEDKKKLIKACKLVKEVFPDMYGNVRFNLHPEREKVNCNIEYSFIIQSNEYFEN